MACQTNQKTVITVIIEKEEEEELEDEFSLDDLLEHVN